MKFKAKDNNSEIVKQQQTIYIRSDANHIVNLICPNVRTKKDGYPFKADIRLLNYWIKYLYDSIERLCITDEMFADEKSTVINAITTKPSATLIPFIQQTLRCYADIEIEE